ncbi:transposase [Methanosarcina horonobensis]|uniref:transposase n=1 Tax=Methanosarcina horonobensis TaxID=418008 RepID=UPI0009E4AD1A|nr:transposase [Methanosarcina horonobensis]
MHFEELSDAQWKYIRFHLPPQPKVGRKRVNDRQIINGILYVLVTGCQWRDMPKQYGSYVTAWRRLKRWSEEGVWDMIFDSLKDDPYRNGQLSLGIVAIDSSFVEAKKGEKVSSIMDSKREKE